MGCAIPCGAYVAWMDRNRACFDEVLAIVADDPVTSAKVMEAWRDIEHWLGFLSDRGIEVDIKYDENAGRFLVDVVKEARH